MIAPVDGKLVRAILVASSHSFERTIAFEQWKNTRSIATIITLRGSLPLTAKLAIRSGSTATVGIRCSFALMFAPFKRPAGAGRRARPYADRGSCPAQAARRA